MPRFDVSGAYIYDFGHEFLVECPKCNEKAHIHAGALNSTDGVHLSCLACGHTKQWQGTKSVYSFSANEESRKAGEVRIGMPRDWYFHLPLWLQHSCCGSVLWAYNAKHLDWLKSYVGATLREGHRSEMLGYENQAMASRLPKWMTAAKNRDKVLAVIENLEIRLG